MLKCISKFWLQLAGLCHDLGHGPFSHAFDGRVMKELLSSKDPAEQWHHERGSIMLLDFLFKTKSIAEGFKKWGFAENDLQFVKTLIICSPNQVRIKSLLFIMTFVDKTRWQWEINTVPTCVTWQYYLMLTHKFKVWHCFISTKFYLRQCFVKCHIYGFLTFCSILSATLSDKIVF